MDAMPAFDQLQRRVVDHVHWRYELIRPVVLMENRPAAHRAEDTHTHPETVRDLTRRFRQQGTLGLFPEHTGLLRPRRGQSVPDVVVEELARLKALYEGLGYREVARIIWYKLQYHIDDKTIKQLWEQRLMPVPGEPPVGLYHRQADRYQARLQVVKLYYQGWHKRRISHVMQVWRPTVDRWMRRFEAEHVAGLEDQSRAPHTTPRKVWLALMIEIYHRQKRHPDAGEFRLWSLRANDTMAVRPVGRVMALNTHVYDDIPPVAAQQAQKPPGPHPDKATSAHHYWCIDGRMLDFALDGVKWWSILILDGYSRTL